MSGRSGKGGGAQPLPKGSTNIIREPADNVYGNLKVYRRTDGLFTVFDPTARLPEIAKAPTFKGESAEVDARTWAKNNCTSATKSGGKT